jgi:hypothetical protein
MENNEFDPFTYETSEEEKQIILSMEGNKKIWNYFLHLVDSTGFQNHITVIRENHLDKEGSVINRKKFEEVKKYLCRHVGLDEIYWSEPIEEYILKNELPTENLSTPCVVFDRIELGEDEYPDGYLSDPYDEWSLPLDPIELEPWSYSHPIVIRVTPYASQREIIDYIKKSYNRLIKPIQESYKLDVPIGKIRKKKPEIQERNKFIYENKDLPRKEIARLVAEKFNQFLDYGHIGKVISIENKKRENK